MEHVDSLDTNLILRFLTNDNPAQRERVRKLLDMPSTNHVFFDVALCEVVYALETIYNFTRIEIVNHLNFFLTQYCDVISYNHVLTSEVFPFYLDHPKLSFVDCCLATMAEINKTEPLFTFDRKLANQHPAAKLLV